uniref:hypothetical protein n=1 Tax=Rhodococcus qingshengii TaxID=334542 RepID=UPI001C4DF84F
QTAVGDTWVVGSPIGALGIPENSKDLLMIASDQFEDLSAKRRDTCSRRDHRRRSSRRASRASRVPQSSRSVPRHRSSSTD